MIRQLNQRDVESVDEIGIRRLAQKMEKKVNPMNHNRLLELLMRLLGLVPAHDKPTRSK